MVDAPLFPVGESDQNADYDDARKQELIATIERAPAALRAAVDGLGESQLDTPYRNWTIRQIVHHVADSHMHVYIRFKWTLTEDQPVIKAYDESVWAQLDDARQADIESSLQLLFGLHLRWIDVMRRMSDDQWERSFAHPEFDEIVPLRVALPYYAWHGRHHTAQINWVREHRL